MHPARILTALSRFLPEDVVVCADVGNNAYALGHYLRCPRGTDVLMSGYLGSIGFALPAAMGAGAATRGHRRIVSVSGDGGLGQYLAEVTTLVRYAMPVVHVVLVDGELGKISREQITAVRPVWATELVNPDFAGYARSCGARGLRVEGPDDLEPALADAFAVPDGPVVVEVPVLGRAVQRGRTPDGRSVPSAVIGTGRCRRRPRGPPVPHTQAMPAPPAAPTRPSWRARARWIGTLAVMAVVVWLGATRPDWDAIGGALADASAPWIIAAALVNGVSLLVRGAGWAVCADEAVAPRVPLVGAESAFQISQAVNSFVPGRVGEPLKAFILNRRLGGDADSFSALFGSVVVHRLMDVVPLTIVSAIVLAFGDLGGGLRASVAATIAVSAVLIGLAARLAMRPGSVVRTRRIAELLDAARSGFMVLRRRGPLVGAVILEGTGWSIQILVAWLGFRAFGIEEGFVAAAAVIIATNAATLVPLWPGNVGLVQVAIAIALNPWGVPESTAIAFGLALQGAEILSALVLGMVGMAVEGLGVRDLVSRGSPAAAPGPLPDD